jgi:hypothetical protein
LDSLRNNIVQQTTRKSSLTASFDRATYMLPGSGPTLYALIALNKKINKESEKTGILWSVLTHRPYNKLLTRLKKFEDKYKNCSQYRYSCTYVILSIYIKISVKYAGTESQHFASQLDWYCWTFHLSTYFGFFFNLGLHFYYRRSACMYVIPNLKHTCEMRLIHAACFIIVIFS